MVKKKQKVLEKDITNAILRYLRALPDCFCWKEHGGQFGTAGIPDIIVCYKGRFVGFEVKSETGRVSKLQDLTIGKIIGAGGIATVVRTVGDVKAVIEELDRHG